MRLYTLKRIAAHDGEVLVVHDATELDYTSLGSLAEALGPARARDLFGLVNLTRDADEVCRRSRRVFRDEGGRAFQIGNAVKKVAELNWAASAFTPCLKSAARSAISSASA